MKRGERQRENGEGGWEKRGRLKCRELSGVYSVITRYAIYGPRMPKAFENIIPMEIPVCRRHVGYVSIACRLMAKKVIAVQNFTTVIRQIAWNWYSSAVFFCCWVNEKHLFCH